MWSGGRGPGSDIETGLGGAPALTGAGSCGVTSFFPGWGNWLKLLPSWEALERAQSASPLFMHAWLWDRSERPQDLGHVDRRQCSSTLPDCPYLPMRGYIWDDHLFQLLSPSLLWCKIKHWDDKAIFFLSLLSIYLWYMHRMYVYIGMCVYHFENCFY